MVAIITSLSVVVIAIIVGWSTVVMKRNHEQKEKASVTTSSPSGEDDMVVYVIGDLHGDVECAKQWVNHTQLIHPITKQWRNNGTSHLVFLGDYIDKGIHSKGTIEYVKYLTDTYPDHVTAILGNHEMELLRDRTESIWGSGTATYYQLPYATAHPGEYLNYLSPDDITDVDHMVVEALYNASIEVYGRGLYRNVYFIPDTQHSGSILHYIPDERIRSTVQDRLRIYQKSYIDTYRTGTELGTWLEQRPIIKVLYGTVFVHGGLSQSLSATPQFRTIADVELLNQQYNKNSIESRLHSFLQSSSIGKIVYDLVVYRGNHKDGACEWLPSVLPKGVYRLAVGHTPSSNVRITDCDNQHNSNKILSSSTRMNGYSVMALDSALSRWFRNSGNDYCSGTHAYHSSNQQYTCHAKNDHCQGQIVRITHSRATNTMNSNPSPTEQNDDPTGSRWNHQSVQVDILSM